MEENYFELGGTVLCLATHEAMGPDNEPLYVRGRMYTVDGMRLGCKHNPILLALREVLPLQDENSTYCTECNKEFMGTWHRAVDFVAITLDEAEELSQYTPEQLLMAIDEKLGQ